MHGFIVSDGVVVKDGEGVEEECDRGGSEGSEEVPEPDELEAEVRRRTGWLGRNMESVQGMPLTIGGWVDMEIG